MKKKWSELTARQQTLVLVGASIELALTATSLVDLARRLADKLRGPKPVWFAGVFIQPIGPIAYLTVGIRR